MPNVLSPEDANLPKHSKGMRPQFFHDPTSDKLLAMVMALAGEVSVMRDRNDTLERLIDAKGLLDKSEIDQYKPSKEVIAERDAWRQEYLSHILRIVDLDAGDMGRNDVSPEWQAVMDEV
ncbi:MAG: hypothetical protein P8L66_05825 [Rhodospirillaceae bacterium]|nr:hypothetical protein [Rhodospirillaceae bacterium]